ncbi:MAG TPA: two-component regulator propeller domain-containing protein, partial [Bacteroidia bacterium]|nr:two-component regulator propeller domain-containing protein [Bacteroidia bacterium]
MQVRVCATIILLIVFLLKFTSLDAQEIACRQFTPDNGLASSEVYDVHQDKLGYIWFATDRGLCRFDGYSFETFTVKHGLGDNVVFSITEDPKGILWLTTFSAGVFCYSYDRGFYPASFNKNILNIIKKHLWVDKLTLDKEGDPWMSIKNSSAQNTYYSYKNGKFDTVSFPAACNSETVVMPIGNTLIFERNFTLHSKPLSIRKGPLNSTILQLPTEHVNDCIYIKDSAILCIYDNKILIFKNN